MDIKAELRLIREQCPIMWSKIIHNCPKNFQLKNMNKGFCFDYGLNMDYCKQCWDKAIEEEIENE